MPNSISASSQQVEFGMDLEAGHRNKQRAGTLRPWHGILDSHAKPIHIQMIEWGYMSFNDY